MDRNNYLLVDLYQFLASLWLYVEMFGPTLIPTLYSTVESD